MTTGTDLKKIGGKMDLAEQSAMLEVHISDIQRGAREIRLNNLIALAKGLEISVSGLVSGIDKLKPTGAGADDFARCGKPICRFLSRF